MDTIEVEDTYTNVEASKYRRIGDNYQTFDSDMIESLERKCDVAITDLRDKKENRKVVEDKLQDVGLCTNMIDESRDYASDIEYHVGFVTNNLGLYRKDIVSAEEAGMKFFTDLSIDFNSPTTIYPVIYEVDNYVQNLPSLNDASATIQTGSSTTVVDSQTVAPEAEQADLVNILPDPLEGTSGIVVESQAVAPQEEYENLYNILPDSLRGESVPSTQPAETQEQRNISEIPFEGIGGLSSTGSQTQSTYSGQSINDIAANFTSGISSGS